jgi:hypothetical protein
VNWAARKQQFIRWYGGYFVNDPKADVIMFGLVISPGALRLHRAVRLVKRYWQGALAMVVAAVVVIAAS